VLAVFGLDRHRVTVLSDVPDGNANWLVTDGAGHRLVLRRHHSEATFEDLTWEYAVVQYLAGAGWNVPAPLGELTDWAVAAAAATRSALDTAGAAGLPVMVVHGDFAEWNVHYTGGHLTGVIDFGLAHLDSRPFELAMARTYRAPRAAAAYRAELARLGWPLSPAEEAAIEPVYQAVRVGLAAWPMELGRRTGRFDLAAIERQLSRSRIPPP